MFEKDYKNKKSLFLISCYLHTMMMSYLVIAPSKDRGRGVFYYKAYKKRNRGGDFSRNSVNGKRARCRRANKIA